MQDNSMNWNESVQQSLGTLDTHCFGSILGIHIDYEYDFARARRFGTAILQVTYPAGPNPDRMLILRIDGFQSLRIPTLMGDLAEFRELEIRDISSDQIEGVHYRITDYRSEFECNCDRVVLQAVYAFQHETVGEVIWEVPM